MSVKGGRKRVSFGLVCFQVVLAYEVIVLCKCSGKYIDIYFKLKIKFLLPVPHFSFITIRSLNT